MPQVKLDVDEKARAERAESARNGNQPPQVLDAAKVADWIEAKFARLRDEWKANRGHESSSMKLVMHPAYQKIIGMGVDAVPLLLRELAIAPDMWFLALRSITEADPVTTEISGNVKEMAKAWLAWGKERGYQW